MKAVILEQNGGPENLRFVENFPEPELQPNEVLVRIGATSLNRVDLHLRKGYPGLSLEFPHILGGDIAGTVEKVGDNVRHLTKGKRVVSYPIILPKNLNPKFNGLEQLNDGWKYYGMHTKGSYAEFVAVPEENLYVIADNVSFEEACTLPIAGLTAYHAINTVSGLNSNDIFFIWGGSSGLGSFAIQLAKNIGARVIATVGNKAKRDTVLSFGADYVFNHHEDDVVSEVRKLFSDGVDVVLDFVGPATFERSSALLRKGGRMLICGMLTGREVNFNIQQFYLRHLNISGLYLGSLQEFRNLVNLLNEGQIRPHIDQVFELKDADKAHRYMESGQHVGKIVLKT